MGNEISIGAVGSGRHEKRGLGGSFMFMERGILEMECPHGPRARSEFLFILPMLLGPLQNINNMGRPSLNLKHFFHFLLLRAILALSQDSLFFFLSFWSWSPRIIPCLIEKFIMVNG